MKSDEPFSSTRNALATYSIKYAVYLCCTLAVIALNLIPTRSVSQSLKQICKVSQVARNVPIRSYILPATVVTQVGIFLHYSTSAADRGISLTLVPLKPEDVFSSGCN